MRQRFSTMVWLAAWGCIAGLVWAEGSKPEVSPERVAQLIRQLGAPTFAEREQASKALEAIGAPALPALKEAAAKSEDIEVKRRASDLVRVIEGRLAAEKLRSPTLVSVAYHNTPVVEVLKDLTDKTGVPFELQLPPDRQAQVGRKLVTLRLDQKPLWEVADEVLAACGLRPAEPTTATPLQQALPVEEGTLDKNLIHYSGAVRIRRLTRFRAEGKPQAAASEVMPLEVCVEPRRFIVDGEPDLVGVQLLDKQGQPVQARAELVPAEVSNPPEQPPIAVVPGQGGVIVAQVQVNARIVAPGIRNREPRWRVLAILILAVDKEKLPQVASVRGQLDVRVLDRDEVVIQNPLQAQRKVYGDRAQVRLVEASQETDRVKIVLEAMQVQPANGPRLVVGPAGLANQDVQLFDDQNQPCRLVGRGLSISQANNQIRCEMTLTFLLPRQAAKPSRLVVSNYVPTTLTVPFQLPLASR